MEIHSDYEKMVSQIFFCKLKLKFRQADLLILIELSVEHRRDVSNRREAQRQGEIDVKNVNKQMHHLYNFKAK